MRRSKASSRKTFNRNELVASSYKYQQSRMTDNNLEMVNDVIRIWWMCHGMPSLLQVLFMINRQFGVG